MSSRRVPEVDFTDREATAEYLLGLVRELAWRVRENDPVETQRWLQRVPAAELRAFAVILAAHIDVDRSQDQHLAWWTGPDMAATNRAAHRAFVAARDRGVPIAEIDPVIREGERRYHAARPGRGMKAAS